MALSHLHVWDSQQQIIVLKKEQPRADNSDKF